MERCLIYEHLKVQTNVTCVSSLQKEQTLVSDHFMVPQALEILHLCDTKPAEVHDTLTI